MNPRLLAGLAMMLAAAVLVEFLLLGDEASQGAPGRLDLALPAPSAVGPDAAGHAAWVEIAAARPLLRPDRRAPAQESAAIATATRLMGIMTGPFGNRAIFALTGGGRPAVVEEGTLVGNYLVEQIGADSVVVLGPQGRETLRPRFAAGPAARPCPAPRPVPHARPQAQPPADAVAPAPVR
jgi:hypothetical protein